jgi:site-specific DNA-methyltransferase (adenine-specific)
MNLIFIDPKFGLHLGDGIAGLRNVTPGAVDFILSDFPYGTTENEWDRPLDLPAFWAAANQALKPNGAVALFGQCPYDKILAASNLRMLRYEWVWVKNCATGFLNAKKMPLKKHEVVLIFYRKLPVFRPQFGRGKPYYKVDKKDYMDSNYGKFLRQGIVKKSAGERYPTSILNFASSNRGLHPTQKPVALFEYLIRTYTAPGELVVDICAGSGTTAIACINTQRNYLCFEKNETYYYAAAERIRKHHGELFTHASPDLCNPPARKFKP